MPAKLTPKQRRFLKLTFDHLVKGDGTSATQTAIEAGYSPNTAKVLTRDILGKPGLVNGMAELMERAGLTDDALVEKIKQGINAGVIVMHHGRMIAKEIPEAPDYQSQFRFLELALKAKGRLPKDAPAVAVQVNVENPVKELVEIIKASEVKEAA